MTGSTWNSPFGARPISAAQILAETSLRARQDGLRRARLEQAEAGEAEGGSDAACVADKYRLLRALNEAGKAMALSDRAICVLEALLSFHPGRALDGATAIIVFPSNRELSLRSRGMAPATLRRHLAALVSAGLILRRDSPNGKRYRRRGEDGEGEAFGFDLSPLALRSAEIEHLANANRARRKEMDQVRSAISLHRRDIRKVLEAALEENRPGDWLHLTGRLAGLKSPGRGSVELGDLCRLERDLQRLRQDVEDAYLSSLTDKELSANDAQNERHYQNSKPDSPFESERTDEKEKGKICASLSPVEDGEAALEAMPEAGRGGKPRFDLGRVLQACPDIADHAAKPIRNMADLVAVADRVRGYLGVSSDAFREARRTMGDEAAASVVAAMLQRTDHIRSPGGYLRNLTSRARKGQFDVEPMLRALMSKGGIPHGGNGKQR